MAFQKKYICDKCYVELDELPDGDCPCCNLKKEVNILIRNMETLEDKEAILTIVEASELFGDVYTYHFTKKTNEDWDLMQRNIALGYKVRPNEI